MEIETIGISRKDTVSAIWRVVGGEIGHEGGSYDKWHCITLDGRKWNVASDASIGRGNAEVVSPILTYPTDMPILQNVVRAIRKHGGKINSSCGIHVHVDASCLDGRQLGNLAKIVYKQEPLILHALQISQSRLNSYTKPMEDNFIGNVDKYRPKSLEQLGKLWYEITMITVLSITILRDITVLTFIAYSIGELLSSDGLNRHCMPER